MNQMDAQIPDFARFRSYLHLLARLQLGDRPDPDPSDFALLEAHLGFAACRANSEAERRRGSGARSRTTSPMPSAAAPGPGGMPRGKWRSMPHWPNHRCESASGQLPPVHDPSRRPNATNRRSGWRQPWRHSPRRNARHWFSSTGRGSPRTKSASAWGVPRPQSEG